MAFTWYDAFGRPVEMRALKNEQAAPTMQSVRRHDALHPAAGLTPGRLARILRDSIDGDPENYLALAEDMEERDNHYAGVLGIRKRQVAGLEITVEAAGDDAKSQAAADLIREVIGRDGFEDELIDILDAIGKGFSCSEIIWETSERDWRPRAIKWRDPRWFRFDRVDGETPLLRGMGGDEPLWPYKWIFHSAKVKSGLPIRGGIARAAAWSFLFKSFNGKDWAIFCEAYGQPLRLGKYGAGATEKDKEILLDAVANIGTDYAAIVPQSMAVEIVESKVSGNHELYEKRSEFLDRQVSKVVLGQTATTDAIAGGYAVGKTHDNVRDDIERADARQLAAVLNRDLVRPTVDLNMGPQQAYPRVRIGRPEQVDAVKFMAAVEKFVKVGGKVGMSTVRDKIGLPDPEEGEELLGAPATEKPKAKPAPGRKPEPEETPEIDRTEGAARDGHGHRDAIDDAADEAAREWEPLVGPMIAGLEDKIAAAKSLEEVEDILAERFVDMDVSEMQTMLARAAFAARASGEADEDL
jgi:phage gp29-like protein